ncbi:hypothetical protein TKK_0017655 [Trichogramma kaykai]
MLGKWREQEIGRTAIALDSHQVSEKPRDTKPDGENSTQVSSGNEISSEELEGHWWLTVQIGEEEIRGFYDTEGSRTTMNRTMI